MTDSINCYTVRKEGCVLKRLLSQERILIDCEVKYRQYCSDPSLSKDSNEKKCVKRHNRLSFVRNDALPDQLFFLLCTLRDSS